MIAAIPAVMPATAARQRDESDLLARIAGGDEDAFAVLVGTYQDRFYAVARRMLGDDAEAQDAVQNTFLRIFRHAAEYRDDWRASTWLYRILTNVCVDQWRKRRRLATLAERSAAPRACESSAERVDLDRALARVPPEARAILILCYVEELSYAEIARARGISINTVKTQLLRAKRAMRGFLRSENEVPR